MLLLILITVALYIIVIVFLTVVWLRHKDAHSTLAVHEFKVSVIIPVRNEEATIGRLLQCILEQQFPMGSFECIVVNDHSTDNTVKIVQAFLPSYGDQLKVLHLERYEGSPKKSALALGIKHAAGEIILTTDGDCEMKPTWIRRMVSAFENKDVQLMMGPVGYQIENTFHAMQWVELSALIGISAVSSYLKHPQMGNGANLAFRKDAYYTVNGYASHAHIPSGDDEFLIKQIRKNFGPESVGFVKHEEATVTTEANHTIGQLINQRIRWASKWRFHDHIIEKIVPVSIFFMYILIVGGWALLAFKQINWQLFLTLMMLKWAVDAIYVNAVGGFLKRRHSLLIILLVEIIYPFYTIFFGLASIFGSYQWKGRKFP